MIADSTKPIALVLGGTNPHKRLIEILKNRGYFTVLIDYYENPPAKVLADEHIRESTLDKDIVLKIANQYHVSLVIATCIDQANAVACYVAERLGLPAPYSYETSFQVTNKPLMKSMMVSSSIPTAKHTVLKDLTNIQIDHIKFPVIVKPSDSNSSKGVKKAINNDDFLVKAKAAFEISRTNEIVVEEFIEGMEVDVIGFIQEDGPKILMIRHRIKVESINNAEMQYYRSIIPAQIPSNIFEKLKHILKLISKSFNLKNTPIQVQAILTENDINVIEFAPRVGGGLSYRTVLLATGFDIVDATVDSYLGKKPSFEHLKPINYFFSEVNLYAYSCVFNQIKGLQELKTQGVIEEFYEYKQSGTFIGSELSSNNRVGAFILKANTQNELFEKYWLSINTLDILDEKMKSVLRKDIYKNPIVNVVNTLN